MLGGMGPARDTSILATQSSTATSTSTKPSRTSMEEEQEQEVLEEEEVTSLEEELQSLPTTELLWSPSLPPPPPSPRPRPPYTDPTATDPTLQAGSSGPSLLVSY